MNFTFLQKNQGFDKLYRLCQEAEKNAIITPTYSAISARKALEFVVRFITKSIDKYADTRKSLFEMMQDYLFQDYLNNDAAVLGSMHYIRKTANEGAHDGILSPKEAMSILEQLHFVVGEFSIMVGIVDDYPVFDKTCIPTMPFTAPMPAVQPKAEPEKKEEVPVPVPVVTVPVKTEKEIKETDKEVVEVDDELIAVYGPRLRYTRFNVSMKRNEQENKFLYLKGALREAGWPMVEKPDSPQAACACADIKIDDNTTADYVLYGRDKRPLAIIEYKSTSQNLIVGRTNVKAKAEKMSQTLGYKPIAYYTDGYHIYVIDQLGYPPRRILQYHSLEELDLLKSRVGSRKDILNPQIDDNITNRNYQKEAIRNVCQAYTEGRRRALLVMATGTGKTRVSISAVDVLMKAGWVKNVLFLADRTSLVRQAYRNFNKMLPGISAALLSGVKGEKRNLTARVTFSTYQTMIRLISEENKTFGIGRFDLIVIDEAHRSVFNRYASLFDYYDALMLGLTATPRTDENKSTYEMFNLENGYPDYAYELEEAINDGNLVGFKVLDRTTANLRRGIFYDELTAEQKAKFEDTFATGDTEDDVDYSGTVISGKDLAKAKYTNIGTIDAMLKDVIDNGLKIDNGNKLGKTMIFASSHREAEIIVSRFQQNYPGMGPNYCKLIDSQVTENLSLIEQLEKRGTDPHIAVSVDMLSTGIDVPDTLNLVFFRRVQSKVLFLQMIGRGTRPSQDIFGPGKHKKGFLIFDYFDNFNYFKARNTWNTADGSWANAASNSRTQGENINVLRLDILKFLIEKQIVTPFDTEYEKELRQYFVDEVRSLDNDDVLVQKNIAMVNKYRTAENWVFIQDDLYEEIKEYIIPLLPTSDRSDTGSKSFDIVMYSIERAGQKLVEKDATPAKIRSRFKNRQESLTKLMDKLAEYKYNKEVAAEEAMMEKIKNGYLFEDFSLEKCEDVRKRFRELIPFIQRNEPNFYIIEADDTVIDNASSEEMMRTDTYSDYAERFIENGDPLLAKIRNLDELTAEEKDRLKHIFTSKLGSPADFAKWSGGKPMLPFLRTKVGIADEAISTKFGSFLNEKVLNEKQMEYMKMMIAYARENGDIKAENLKDSPFNQYDLMALFGAAKAQYVKQLLNGLHKPVKE